MRHLTGYMVMAVVIPLWSLSARAAPVTGDFVLWLDASDVATIADGEGDNPDDGVSFDGTVQTWTDKSGTANHATAGVSRPGYSAAVLNGSGVVTFNPTFITTQSFNTANTNVLNGETMFVVTKMNDNGDSRGGWVGGQATNSAFKNDTNRYILQKDDGDDGRIANSAPQTYQVVSQTRLVVNAGFAPFGVLEDGATLTPTGAANRTGGVTVNSVGRTNGTLYFSGEMAEVMIYNRTLNTAERVVTENYLSSKYGTTMAANDKYAGDTAANAHHDFDVFGIGQDVVTTAPRDPVIFGDTVNISPAGKLASGAGGGISLTERNTSLADGEYLLAGHSGTAHSLTASDVPAGVAQRWARDFFLDVTGTLDARLTFDFASAALGAPTNVTGYTLLYRTGTSGMYSDLGITGAIAGNEVRFDLDAIDTNDDGFYTIGAIAIPEPSSMSALGAALCAMVTRRRWRNSRR